MADLGLSVNVTTNLTPTTSIGLGGGDGSAGSPSPLLSWLQPQVDVISGGTTLYSVAPFGNPSPPDSLVPSLALVAGVLTVLFGSGFLLGRLTR